MFKREIEKELLKWKKSKKRKVLILRGARQVGKTSIIRKFGQENFENIVEINLEKNEQKSWFRNVLSIEDFTKRIEINLQKKLIDKKTLLFIDEAQELIEVMQLLRFFAEEKPNLHVVVAGSLMDIKLEKKQWSMPVGRVEYLYLYPANFFEYLGTRNKTLLDILLQIKKPSDIDLPTHHKAQELYEEYLQVGGMPEVIEDFQKNKSILSTQEIHSRLYNSYLDDIGKYASKTEKKYLEVVLTMAPKLAGSIFNYENMGESGYRSREIAEAVRILEKIMLLKQVMAVNNTKLPIIAKYKRPKKMLWLDVGLANYANKMQGIEKKGKYLGSIMEQAVGQELVSMGKRELTELYYWARNRNEGSAEVDFLLQHGQKIAAFEVKAGTKKKMKSMFSLLNQDLEKIIIPIRVSWDRFKVEKYSIDKKEYKILSLPFYLLGRWKELI